MDQRFMTRWADAGLQPSEEAMRDHLLIGLLQEGGAEIPPDFPERLVQAGIRFAGDWFGLVELKVIVVDAFAYIQGMGHTAYSEAHLAVNISDMLRKRLKPLQNVFVFKIKSEIMCLICDERRGEVQDLQRRVCDEIMALEQDVGGIRFLVAKSDVMTGTDGIKRGNQQLRQMFEYRALHLGLPAVISFELLENYSQFQDCRIEIEQEHAVMSAFKAGHYRQAMEMFGALFDNEYLSFADPLMLLKHKCDQYIYGLVGAVRELCERDITAELGVLQPEQRLLAAGNYAEVRAQMEHIFAWFNEIVLAGPKDGGHTEWIATVKSYIRENFTDPDLNVNKLADIFGRNPSYLSRRFLRMTGQSILDYIHRYRVQEAKILIGQGSTLTEVAERVGYSNALTMSRAFKKYEGTTPGKLKTEHGGMS